MKVHLPVEAFGDGLIVTERDVWGVWQFATRNFALLADDERRDETRQIVSTFASLAGRDCHLMVIPRPIETGRWAAAQRATRGARDGWPAVVDGLEARVRESADELWGKRVYLAVHLGSRSEVSWRQRVERTFGVIDREVPDREWRRWKTAASAVDAALARSALHGGPATTGDLVWLYQRAFTRHQSDPDRPLARARWGAGEVEMLTDADVVRTEHTKHLRLVDDAGETLVRWYTCLRFPDEIPAVGGEWMHALDVLPFPVEWSHRFLLRPHRDVAADAKKKRDLIRDQVSNAAGTGHHLPAEITDAADGADDIIDRFAKLQEPMAYGRVRFAVWASDIGQLDARSKAAVDTLRDYGIEAAAMGGRDQWSHFLEALPGTRVGRIGGVAQPHMQRHRVTVLGKSGLRASSTVGDGEGPYIGRAYGATVTPVYYDPLLVARRNIAPGVLITGTPGSGKTFAASLLLTHAVYRGAVGLAIDPKGEFDGVAGLFGDSQIVKLTDDAYRGVFDPYRIADDPAAAVELAHGMIQLLVPGGLGDMAQTAMFACAEVAQQPHPTLSAVIDVLARHGDRRTVQLGETLRAVAAGRLGRLLFAGSLSPRMKMGRGLTVVQFDGMDLPDTDSDRADWTQTNRVSVAVLQMIAHGVRRVMTGLPASWPKIVVFDESHTLNATPAGRRLAPAMARLGRSANTVPVFVSQSARDFAADDGLRASVPTRFVFRNRDRDEAEACTRLLDLDAGRLVPTIQQLETGQAIFADPYGGVGQVEVDAVFRLFADAFDTTPPEDHVSAVERAEAAG